MTITFGPQPAAPAAAPEPTSATAAAISPQQLAALLAAAQHLQPAAPVAPALAAAPVAWGAAAQARVAAPPPPAPIGLAIPLRVELGDGSSVKPLLIFGPESAGPGVLLQLIDSLLAANVPVDVWRPKSDNDGRGGWSRGRGGYR